MKVNGRVRDLVVTAFLAAAAFCLTLLPIPKFAGFLQPEISDVPAIVAAFAVNPVAGVLVKLVQNMIDAVVKPVGTIFIGQIANFAIGAALTLPVVYITRVTKKYWLGAAVGVVAMTIVGILGNLFLFFPVYGIEGDARWGLIISAIIPFNLVKGTVEAILALLLINALKPVLKVWGAKLW